MPVATRVVPSVYYDSVTLMQLAQDLQGMPGVRDVAAVMGTPANLALMRDAGLWTATAQAATPNDLVLAVLADDEATAQRALSHAQALLAQRQSARSAAVGAAAGPRPRSLRSAVAQTPGANLAVISVAGRYAAREARQALQLGLHVLLFSDNVSLEDEIALKALAAERGLLCMGPDAGTAIINGVGLGFANAVPRGPIGIVSAAGTGLQSVSSDIARRGSGVSQAIGTGGRDLSEAVGGRTMLAGLEALQTDPDTSVIVLISKPPAEAVTTRLLEQVRRSKKPTVVCFLGADPGLIERAGAIPASTLEQAAAVAVALARGEDWCSAIVACDQAPLAYRPQALAEQAKLHPGQRFIRGLFSGGTFCYEAQLVAAGLPDPVYSNTPIHKPTAAHQPPAEAVVHGQHVFLDLGADEYTVGRLHPMLDPTLRNRLIVQAADDPEVAVLLLDVVLGYGAHPDPAGEAARAIVQARARAEAAGRYLPVVAFVCGTEEDPQRLSSQEAKLRAAGALVTASNAQATRVAALILAERFV
ncbi:MAG: acyl-CoA synthetase FdrA [Caldilineales bacterium]|nr:acyl-CoA synthetase FdrA [Caldilineales bacterium]